MGSHIPTGTKSLGSILLVLVLFGCLVGCDGKGEPMPILVVQGTVSDSITGEPIPEAKVLVLDTPVPLPAATTDSSGRYRVYPGRVGETRLVCEKPGYLPDTQVVDLVIRKYNYEVNFLLAEDQ